MQHSSLTPGHGLEFVAGALCLDFTNTLGGSRDRPTHDHLRSYADLIAFAQEAGILTASASRRLLADAARHPQVATEVHRRSVALREAISRAFAAIAMGREPSREHLDRIGAEAAEAYAHARVTPAEHGFDWTWPESESSLALPIWHIARSAIDLITDGADRARVRECASETCTWLFLDQSRNRSRRWCDMNDCGNRAKQRRFQRRKKQSPRTAR